jgi:hypothetical protein
MPQMLQIVVQMSQIAQKAFVRKTFLRTDARGNDDRLIENVLWTTDK